MASRSHWPQLPLPSSVRPQDQVTSTSTMDRMDSLLYCKILWLGHLCWNSVLLLFQQYVSKYSDWNPSDLKHWILLWMTSSMKHLNWTACSKFLCVLIDISPISIMLLLSESKSQRNPMGRGQIVVAVDERFCVENAAVIWGGYTDHKPSVA